MAAAISIFIAVLSLAVSTVTLWFTLLRRGHLAMTKPTIVFFGFDVVPKPTPKIFLRSLLYSTSARGKIIEGMYVRLSHAGTEQIFSFWGYGEANKLSPGSGLYVGQTGIAANHHFVLSVHQPGYEFKPGAYTIRVFARLVGKSRPVEFPAVSLSVTEEQASALMNKAGVLFELGPDSEGYIGHVSDRP